MRKNTFLFCLLALFNVTIWAQGSARDTVLFETFGSDPYSIESPVEGYLSYGAAWANAATPEQVAVSATNERGPADAWLYYTGGQTVSCKDKTTGQDAWIHIQPYNGAWAVNNAYDYASNNAFLRLEEGYNTYFTFENINIEGLTDLKLTHGWSTCYWWQSPDLPTTRPACEISVNGGEFFALETESEFNQPINETEYEDQVLKLIEWDLVQGETPVTGNTISIRFSSAVGRNFIDDIILSGSKGPTTISPLIRNTLHISPNPATDYIDVKNTGKIDIYDLQSRLIYSTDQQGRIDIRHLQSGIYFIKAAADGKVNTIKLIKK